jgi:MFS family permease
MHFLRRPASLALGPFSVWLSLPQLITWGSVFYTFSLLMTPLEAELGMSRAESSLAFSLALLAEGLMAYLIGRWIDHGHERWVMTLGSVWVGVGLLAHSQVQSVSGFYAVWVWLGLGLAATLYSPAFAVVTRRFGQDFRRAIITLTFLGGLASTVFIPLSSWWIALWGWRHALWALAALQLLLCAPLHAWLLQGAAKSVQHQGSEPGGPREHRVTMKAHLRQAPFWLLATFSLLMMAVTSALPAHMIALLEEASLPPAWVIAIPAAIGVIQVIGRFVLFVFERYWDVHTANRWIPMLIPSGLLVLIVFGLQTLPAMVFVLLYGLGNGMNTIVKGTAMAQYVSRDHVGQLNGLMGLPIALARAAAPLTMGVLWSPAHGYGLALWWLLLASLMATAALWMAQRQALKNRL